MMLKTVDLYYFSPMGGTKKAGMAIACVAACPTKMRILPPPLQDGMTQKLCALKDMRRKNEFYE